MKKLGLLILALTSLGLGSNTVVAQANTKYYTANPGIIRTKNTVVYYQNAAKTKKAATIKANHYAKITKVVTVKGHTPLLKTNTGKYVTANKAFVAKTAGYQNPKKYYQVNYTQIKPYGKVGYTVKRNYEGIKTWKIMKRLGTQVQHRNLLRRSFISKEASSKGHR